MSISLKDININIIVFPEAGISLAEATQQLPEDKEDLIVVIHLTGDVYACISAEKMASVLGALRTSNEKRKIAQTSLSALFGGFGCPAVELEDASLDIYRAPWKESPNGIRAVLSAGKVVGVMPIPETMRGDSGVMYSGAGMTGQAPSEQPVKFIDSQIWENTTRINPREKTLKLNAPYTIKLSIKDTQPKLSDVQDAILKYLWGAGEQEVTLTVLVQSNDFECPSKPLTLVVPRVGNSKVLEFPIRTQHQGRCELRILFYKDDAFIQLLTLTYTVGDLFFSDTSGRVMDAAFVIKPRSLNLTILESRGGFQLVMSKDGQKKVATLPITKNDLDEKIRKMRKVLREKVLHQRDPQDKVVYLEGIKIDPAYRDHGLSALAELGYEMYRDIFFNPSTTMDEEKLLELAQLGEEFYKLVRGGVELKIQIFSQHFMMPWGILYIANPQEYDPANVKPEWFLGFSHIIEHIPLWQTMLMQSTNTVVDTSDGLVVSININRSIDAELKIPLVKEQEKFWTMQEKTGKISLIARTTSKALLGAMRDTQATADEVVYFYCHAVSIDLEGGGPDFSKLIFSPRESLTLGDLKKEAPYTQTLPGEPLVFINACETAELSPLFYDGFVPYFLAKGARGVIGTECEIPAIFASEWAKRFFKRFLAGEPVGAVVLQLRKEFLEQENNLLGLLYALYVDGDTRLEPGIT